jgi:8-oxo-dGTP diphosphatase
MGKDDQGLRKGNRYKSILRVLVFLRNDTDVLLLKGASNKNIWANLYNGVGGHVEADEDILSAAHRELMEESGLQIDNLELKAIVNIDAGDHDLGILMFAFVGWTVNRQAIASEEGALHWIPVDKLNEIDLVEDLYWLLPRIIDSPKSSQPLYLHYSYDSKDRLVIQQSKIDVGFE